MSTSHPTAPPALGKILALLPPYPGAVLFAGLLNRLLARHLPSDTRTQLQDKKIRINVFDLNLGFDFCWQAGSFHACSHKGAIDLSIGANAHDFLLLAQRKEDPDTLFFSRRLQMEGDTNLGLMVKNTLDAIEIPVFDPARVIAFIKSGAGLIPGANTA